MKNAHPETKSRNEKYVWVWGAPVCLCALCLCMQTLWLNFCDLCIFMSETESFIRLVRIPPHAKLQTVQKKRRENTTTEECMWRPQRILILVQLWTSLTVQRALEHCMFACKLQMQSFLLNNLEQNIFIAFYSFNGQNYMPRRTPEQRHGLTQTSNNNSGRWSANTKQLWNDSFNNFCENSLGLRLKCSLQGTLWEEPLRKTLTAKESRNAETIFKCSM